METATGTRPGSNSISSVYVATSPTARSSTMASAPTSAAAATEVLTSENMNDDSAMVTSSCSHVVER